MDTSKNTIDSKKIIYSFCVIAAGILWGTMSIFVRSLSELGFSSRQIMLMRSLLASGILAAVIALKNPALFKIHLRDIWIFIGSGILSMAFFSVCYFSTIIECGASVAVVLLYTSPVFVLILSAIFFKEKITFLKASALVITFAGCVFVAGIFGSGTSVSPKGFFVGLLSGLGYGLYSIFGRVALKKYETLTVTFYSLLFASVAMIPLSSPVELAGAMSVRSFLFFLGTAVFCTLLPFLLYTFGLSGLEAGRAAIFATVEPLVGTLIGIFLWKESAGFFKLLGIAMIFAAIILASLPERKGEN